MCNLYGDSQLGQTFYTTTLCCSCAFKKVSLDYKLSVACVFLKYTQCTSNKINTYIPNASENDFYHVLQ